MSLSSIGNNQACTTPHTWDQSRWQYQVEISAQRDHAFIISFFADGQAQSKDIFKSISIG